MFCKSFGNCATGFSFALLEIVNFILSSYIFVPLIFTFIPYFSCTYISMFFYFTLLIDLFLTKLVFRFYIHLTVFFFEKTLSFAWLKERNKMFVLYLRNFSLIIYIQHKNVQMKCGEPFYKMVVCLHVIQRICYFYFATFWLGALYTFEIWLDWTFL